MVRGALPLNGLIVYDWLIDRLHNTILVKHCVFSMGFDNIQLVKNVAATLLLLLLVLVVASNANPLRRCGENRFFDHAAQICTKCDDICDPRRGTPYLCNQYAAECGPRE